MWKIAVIGALLSSAVNVDALKNGQALTPPMGWMSWQRFRCLTNCTQDPDDCISERLIKETADKMVSEGYLDAGYQYVIIDDCYLAKDRDANGNLQPDPSRFPSGMKKLSEYVRSKGLKFGIYENYGTKTCAGYPGVFEDLERDAKTLVDWGADYVKIDGCYADPAEMDEGYQRLGAFLLKAKPDIVYSCSWPYYQYITGIRPDYETIAKTCNLWRNYDDIQDSWGSVRSIMNHYGDEEINVKKFSAPGQWNDPDMLIIGNYGLSYEQSKVQMAVWAILAAPLLMSHDLRNVRQEFREILLNKKAIAINQDKLGIMGSRVYRKDSMEVWTRPVEPVVKDAKSFAIAFVNVRTDGSPNWISVTGKRIGLDPNRSYALEEVFDSWKPFNLPVNGTISVRVPITGVLFFKATVK